MKIGFICATAAVLVGCAITSPEQAAKASTMALCEAVIYGSGTERQIAGAEATRRGIDCRDYAQAVAAERQRRTGAALSILQQQQRTVNCTSTTWGNTVDTTCR